MTMDATSELLKSAATPQDLLVALKDLKNLVIGNTWKKVQVSEDEQVLQLLLTQLDLPLNGTDGIDGTECVELELIHEAAVILGALGNVGTLTLRPLLAARAPDRILHLIRELYSLDTGSRSHNHNHNLYRALPPLLRALRNVLVSTADVVWGHMWGVGSERRVVGTGLVGIDVEDSVDSVEGKGKGKGKGRATATASEEGEWRGEAKRALGLVFQDENLDTLVSLVHSQSRSTSTSQQVLLPLYQLFARLIVLPSHQTALAKWQPTSSSPAPPAPPRSHSYPFILTHLLGSITDTISGASGVQARRNHKLLEATLDLLASLVKGQAELAGLARGWKVQSTSSTVDAEGGSIPGFIGVLVEMMRGGNPGVRIAAAGCLTNIIKADKASRTNDRIRTSVMNLQLLHIIHELLNGETYEERTKLCFVLAALVSDDAQLQVAAERKGCPKQIIEMVARVQEEETRGDVGTDTASRSREALLLALAALSFQHEPTRILISEHEPPFLPFLLQSLSHQSYGVRAAACQLARALSRTVSILRTSLLDSGVGEEVIRLLKREMAIHDRREPGPGDVAQDKGKGKQVWQEDSEQTWTVEVAALATICNLVTDFSPLRTKLISAGHLNMLCSLAQSRHEPLSQNALWAIKNLTFHSSEAIKTQVMACMGFDSLKSLMSRESPLSLRAQALSIGQNLLADATPAELNRWTESFGEDQLLDLIRDGVVEMDVDVATPAFGMLANVSLGNERTRQAIVGRVEIAEALSGALTSKHWPVQIPALRCVRFLLESSGRYRRPRAGMLEVFQPYQLRPRLEVVAEKSPSHEVREGAKAVLAVLDRGREGVARS